MANPVASFRPGARTIAKAAVIGAGSMGSGIAAQFANAGVPVVLLDLPSEGEDRAAVAKAGIANQLKAGGYMRADAAGLVTPGTTDDLSLLADADLIVEAVIERLDVKQDLFRRLESVRKDGSIVSSNTSTIPRAAMAEGLPGRFVRDFVITHFFNPPRHMALVELVGGPEVPAATLQKAAQVCETELGKTVVVARDTPGFIANRIGCYWLAMAALEAIEAGLDVETADAIAAAVCATPKTGVFGLFDLVGVDLVPHVWGSLHAALPPDDPFQSVDLRASPVFQDMLENRRFGRKTKGGFYRLAADRSKEAWDYQAKAYRPERRPARIGPEVADADGPEGRFARRVLAQTVAYAAATAPEIADAPEAVDTAMRLGYGWSKGPFALAAVTGEARVADWLRVERMEVPQLLAERVAEDAPAPSAKAQPSAVVETPGAALLDIGDGVGLLELRTKMNIFTEEVFYAIRQTLTVAPGRFRAVVLTGAGERAYSAGANLAHMQAFAQAGDYAAIEAFVRAGQAAFQSLKRAPFPVVGAAFGLALGGGCESLLHCDAIVAHAELNAGLPESKVGLVPGWGGCTLMFARALAEGLSPDEAAARAFDAILAGRVSTSALDAAGFGVLRKGDRIVMNRALLMDEAKAVAVALAQNYRAQAPAALPAGGLALRERLLALTAGRAELTDYDLEIAGHVARVLSGGERTGEIGEAEMLDLEREALVALVRNPQTHDRIAHMLAAGKPLRN
jgi:3-hydroxyacyl-CoA dehydrogenase